MVTVAYPVEVSYDDLSPEQRSMKIARYSPCTNCTCSGLHPPPGITVVSDNPVLYSEPGGDDDDEEPQSYLQTCGCGHGYMAHTAKESELGSAEHRRRTMFAIRIDENLQVFCPIF